MKYKITFSYDGTNYYGYEIQPKVISIQETLEKEISVILNEKIRIYSSGRTDRGVHAFEQVATFDTNKDFSISKFLVSINKLLPKDIYVKSIESVDDNFDARFSSKYKIYQYYINTVSYDVFRRNYEVFIPNLNIEKMKEVSSIFVGKHCFKNYCSKPIDKEDFIREISYIHFIETNGNVIIEFKGSGFMTYMVRKIVGSLIEVGKGKMDKEDLLEYLENNKRDIMPFTAESRGLFLKKVGY